MLKFSEGIKFNYISQNLIIKIFRQIIQKLKVYYHLLWPIKELGLEPTEDDKLRIEIDQNKVIVNENSVI